MKKLPEKKLSYFIRNITYKLEKTKSWYAIRGTAAYGVLTACPPKGEAFRYRTAHLFAKNLPQANFFNRKKPSQCSSP